MTTINDIHDLHRILVEHPEWRSELRNIILTRELLEVPDRLDALTLTVQALTATVQDLAETTGRRLDSLESRVDALTATVQALAETTDRRMAIFESRMDSMDTEMRNFRISVDRLRGDGLEHRLAGLIPPLVSREFDVRRVYPMSASMTLASNDRREEFEMTLEEASDAGKITDDEETRLRVTDLVVRSQRKSDRSTLWFAVESSGVLNGDDVTRALRSANAIRKIHEQDAIPVVYGYEISDENRALASEVGVHVFLNSERR